MARIGYVGTKTKERIEIILHKIIDPLCWMVVCYPNLIPSSLSSSMKKIDAIVVVEEVLHTPAYPRAGLSEPGAGGALAPPDFGTPKGQIISKVNFLVLI